MKTALILPTAFITISDPGVDSEERINQYIKGFEQIAEVVKKYPDFDVYAVDNTVKDPEKIDPRLIAIIDKIPTLKGKIFYFDNEFGRKNKGAGLITAWRGFLSKVQTPYEYVISFEPRQQLANFSMFERFVNHPNSYLKLMRPRAKKFRVFPITLHQVLTGFSIFRRKDMELYCKSVNLATMVRDKISIEDDLFDFLFKNQISFEVVSTVGIIWHALANNTYVEY